MKIFPGFIRYFVGDVGMDLVPTSTGRMIPARSVKAVTASHMVSINGIAPAGGLTSPPFPEAGVPMCW
jgi:hypothetical protein